MSSYNRRALAIAPCHFDPFLGRPMVKRFCHLEILMLFQKDYTQRLLKTWFDSIASGQGLGGQWYLRLIGTMRKQINPKRQRQLRAMGMSCSGSIVLTCEALNNNHKSLACMLNILELATLVVHGDTGENPAQVDITYILAQRIPLNTVQYFHRPHWCRMGLSIVWASQTHCFLHNA